MTSLLIRDMAGKDEQYVGTCTNVCLHEAQLPWLQETKSACVASPAVER